MIIDDAILARMERIIDDEIRRGRGAGSALGTREPGDYLFAHTPGPWGVGTDSGCDIGNPVAVMVGAGSENSDTLVGCGGDHEYDTDPAANAKVIAAAPWMIAAVCVLAARLAATVHADHHRPASENQHVIDQVVRLVRRVGG